MNAAGKIVGRNGIATDITARRQTELAAQKHANFVDEVLNSITSNVTVIDPTGKILIVNDAWRNFASNNGAASAVNFYIGCNYLEICRRSVDESADNHARQALVGITSVLQGDMATFILEYPCHAPGKKRWYLMRVSRLTGGRGGAVIKHEDITERTQLEHTIRRMAQGVASYSGNAFFVSLLEELCEVAGAEYGLVGELLPDQPERIRIAASCGPSGNYDGLEFGLAGTPAGQVVGRVLCCYPDAVNARFPEDRWLHDQNIVGYVGTPLFDSSDRPLGIVSLMSCRPLVNPKLISDLLRIITARVAGEIERVRTDRELHRMAGKLLRLQDEERRVLGRELHDSTAQDLSALEINLAALQAEGDRLSAASRTTLKTATAIAGKCAKEIRTMAYLLRPPLLDEAGLLAALRVHVQGFAKRSGIKCKLSLPRRQLRLKTTQELALFRITQEGLANVHRHAGSRSATVSLAVRNENMTLTIADRGRGMPVDILEKFNLERPLPGVGLMGMVERVRQLGGHMTIQSSRRGTSVRAVMPLMISRT